MFSGLELVRGQRGHGTAAWPACRAGAGEANPDAHDHRQAEADTHAQPPAIAHADTHTNIDSIGHADAHGDPHPFEHTHAHPNADSNADAHQTTHPARGKVAAVPACAAQEALKGAPPSAEATDAF